MLLSLCNGYQLRNIFNAGLFCRALPTDSMSVKVEDAKIKYLLACSAEGDILEPFVIGHSANPRCFKGLTSLACLPVSYSSNTTSWMTADLFK